MFYKAKKHKKRLHSNIIHYVCVAMLVIGLLTLPIERAYSQSLESLNVSSLENADIGDLGNLDIGDFENIGMDVGDLGDLNIGDLEGFGVDVGDLGGLDISDIGNLNVSDLEGLGVDVGDLANMDLGDLGLDVGDLGVDFQNLDIGELGNFGIGDLQELGVDVGDLANFDIGDLGDFGFDIGDFANFDLSDFGNIDISDLGNFGIDIADFGNINIGDFGLDLGDFGFDIGDLANFDIGDLGGLGFDIGDLGGFNFDLGALGIDLGADLGLDIGIDFGDFGIDIGIDFDDVGVDFDFEAAFGDMGGGGSGAGYYCGDFTGCVLITHTIIRQVIEEQHRLTRRHFGTWYHIPPTAGKSSGTGELGKHQTWMIETIFFVEILPALQAMTRQFSTVAFTHAATIGGFIDSKTSLDSQRTLQDLTAQIHRDYQPSPEMCVIGTNIRSLAETDIKKDVVMAVLNDRGLDRELANSNVNAIGPNADRVGRLEQFQNRFCDRFDNNPTGKSQTGFGLVCNTSPKAETINRDINITRTLLQPPTLELDFSAPAETDDEQNILAMASNLYSHNLFDPPSREILDKEFREEGYENLFAYMDMRSIVAKRNVARTSFNALAAMKAQGSQASTEISPYTAVLLKELGYSDEEALYMITERPSYFAQLEVLSKKLYQRPSFYTDLYDKPANVKRRGVAMQAIGLMVDRDIYDSRLRSEALLSVLLELKIMKAQDALQNDL